MVLTEMTLESTSQGKLQCNVCADVHWEQQEHQVVERRHADSAEIFTCMYSRCVFARVWEILPRTLKLLESMRKHTATANCMKIKGIDKECVIASSDGACIIWDLVEASTRPLKPFCVLFH